MNFTGYYGISMGLNGFYWVFTGFYYILQGFNGFYWIFTGFHRFAMN